MDMGLNIRNCGTHNGDVVFESTNPGVAALTEKRTHATSNMIVVNGKIDGSAVALAAREFVANSADTVLVGQYPVVVFNSNSVSSRKISGALLVFWCNRVISLKNRFHVWNDVMTGSKLRVWIFGALSQMKVHSFFSEFSVAVSTLSELPKSGANFNPIIVSPVNADIIPSPLVKSANRTLFAVSVKPVDASAFNGELDYRLGVLAGYAQALCTGHNRNVFTQFSPVSAQSIRSKFFAAKTACGEFFAKHVTSVASYMRTCNTNLTLSLSGE